MQSTVEVRDRRPVVVRTGRGAGATAIRQEAHVLAAIAGPGAPAVLELVDDGELVSLVIAVAPPLNLMGAPIRTVIDALARIADVMQRANAIGIAHGPIRDDDVLADGVSVLLSGWQRAGDADPAGDVTEFGRLVERVATRHADLGAIAARALAPDAPTLAALAAAIRALLPVDRPARRALPGWPLLAALGLGTAVLSLTLLPSGSHRGDHASVELVPPTVVAVHGNVVERGGRRWVVGEPDDEVVIGAWNCDGEQLPAVLRPLTGRVWLFANWPTGSAPVAGRDVSEVPGAARLRVEHTGRCDHLIVEDAQGRARVVR